MQHYIPCSFKGQNFNSSVEILKLLLLFFFLVLKETCPNFSHFSRFLFFPRSVYYLYLSCFCSSLSLVSATLWTVAHQAPLSMEFCREEYWSGLSFPPPVDLLNPGIEPMSLVSPALAGRFFTTEPSGKFISAVIHTVKLSIWLQYPMWEILLQGWGLRSKMAFIREHWRESS